MWLAKSLVAVLIPLHDGGIDWCLLLVVVHVLLVLFSYVYMIKRNRMNAIAESAVIMQQYPGPPDNSTSSFVFRAILSIAP